MRATRYDHKVGCKCHYCQRIDRPGWYAETGPYMLHLDSLLAQKPTGIIEDDAAANYWNEGYFDS